MCFKFRFVSSPLTAVEDAFSLGERIDFDSQETFTVRQDQKRAEIEQFGRTAVLRAASLPRIGAWFRFGQLCR